MWNLNKTIMILSLVFVVVCLCASVWMSFVLRDAVSYVMTVVFLVACIWLVYCLISMKKQNDDNR